jgi:acyl carrier protein
MDGELIRELAGLLRAATGEDEAWAAAITAASRLEDDLGLESGELAAWGDAVRARYGVDVVGYVAGLDLDQIIALTVGDVAALVPR